MKRIMLMSFFLIGMIAYSQTTIQGKVVDQNEQPVPGANIVIVGKAIGAVTDFDGNFILNTSEVPPFQIRVSSIGYADYTTDITSNNETLTITLQESLALLDEIVISASRTPERIFESPVSVERFGLKEIRNTSSPSFYGGLENLKGVDINTNSLTFQSVNTRGFANFANNRFLQLIDGADNSAPGLNFAIGNLVGLSELDVQSVEILPGASSALYGAGAFNGSLFIRSKSPFDFQGISAYAKTGLTSQEAAGDNNFVDFGVRLAHKFSDKFAAKINFSFLRGEDWHAVNNQDINNPGATRDDPNFDGLNIYGDEVSTLLNFDVLAGLPSGTLGAAQVSRTGYFEEDLIDYNAESLKADIALHYRPAGDDFEIIYNGRVGTGSTIFQATNRNRIDNFVLQQHKLEVRNDNFFVRGYITAEDSGDSYDSRFAGINVNRAFKSDVQWFTDYAQTFIGARLGVGSGVQADEAAAHAAARAAADAGRFAPGTTEFQQAFDQVISDGDLATGARFIDQSQLLHFDGNYNISHLLNDAVELQVGGSWRQYRLDSQGTIFTDFDGPITYSEFGIYTQAQKKLLDDRLKLTGSLRFDKNEFFDGFVSPRVAVGYTLGAKKNHNLRVSFQTGFRNPTTQDLFIGLNVGNIVLVGGAPDNLDRDVRTFDVSAAGQQAIGQATVDIVGRQAYENAFSLNSVLSGGAEAVTTPIVQPEEIVAYEIGYRAQLGKVTIDLSGYINEFENFISTVDVVVPLYGTPGDNSLSLLALQNGDFEPYRTTTNSPADITSYGVTAGVDARIFGNFDIGVNYTYADLDFDQAEFPDFRTSFNTANHKVKASFGNTELFKNFGFNVNYRWSDSFFWQASFADGDVPAFTVLDAQFNYALPNIKSVIKVGASNILNDEYFTAVGTGLIGSQYFVSWSFNP